MSSLKAEVIPVKLLPHENADTLSIVYIKGWQCVVKTEDFEGVELGAYIPIDSVLPEKPEWEFLKQYKYRVKTVRLRGALSQGLLIPAKSHWKLGDDVTGELGITKYDPPVPVHLAGGMAKDISGFQKYTSVENFKNYPNAFRPGKFIVITEKLHGTNVRYGVIDGKFCVGTHTTCRDPEHTNIYSTIGKTLNLEETLRNMLKLFPLNKNIILFGEIFGGRIQKGFNYGKKEPGFSAFDLVLDERFVSWAEFKNACDWTDIKTVPLIHLGAYDPLIHPNLAEGQSLIADHIREGIIIKPQIEDWDREIGRVILKKISDDYLIKMGKKGSDYH